MVRTLLIAATIIGSLTVAACNTVRGAAADVNSVANCTENAINTGRCK
jgi:predicted small secreted protein